MFKKFFSKALVVLSIIITIVTMFSISTLAVEENTVMTVYTKWYYEEIYKDFDNFEDGWVYALEQSLEKNTTITLRADWIAPDGNFYCENGVGDEYGTEDGYLYINDDHILTIDLNGYKIDRNLKEPTDDGVVFWINDQDAKITIKDSYFGGKITGANNTGDGGAFYVYNGSLFIEGGEITGNYAENGAGIYWYSDNNLCITGGKITVNIAEENGGGIYHDGGGSIGGGTDNVYFGGDAQIYGNFGNDTETNNVYLESLKVINRTAGQTADIPDVLFTDTAKIGITAEDMDWPISGPDSCFKWGNDKYFFTDSDEFYIKSTYNAALGNNAFMLFIDYLANKPEPPEPIEAVMTVTVDNDALFEFDDFGKGWVYAMKQSISKPVTITLYDDWVAENGKFVCLDENGNEYGSEDGYLYLNDEHILTIDLNGHKIDRNLKEPTDDGVVFRLYDYDARLIIKDSVGGGKITGANNTGNGGAFLAERGGLYILGGKISGNKAANGAGVYWESKNNFCICDGEITGNEAAENGGGIYGTSWGKMHFGGVTAIADNTGKDGVANNLYLSENAFVYGTSHQDEYIPNSSFSSQSCIGITAYNSDACISEEFKDYYGDFHSDSDKYYIHWESVKTANGSSAFKIYISTLDAPLVPGAMTVVGENGNKRVFDDFGKGWVYALKTSLSEQVTIKLGADWVAHNGKFICRDADGTEYGSKDGYLYLNDNYDLIIDLNGHTIDRNLKEPTKDGVIFWLNDRDAKLSFKGYIDGKLTGANNTGNGGAFYVYNGSVYIDSWVTITGNKAKNGAAIYWESANTLSITAATIQGNTATENGGGIYATDSGDMYFGGYVKITENTGANGAPNNLYLANDSVFLNSAKKQEEGVPYRTFSNDTVIGISLNGTGGLISGDDSCFELGDDKYFVMDNKEYYIRAEYDAAGENNAYKLYIDSIKNIPDYETEFKIVNYNEQTKEAIVFIPEAGKYSLVFADYENNILANVDIVEYEFKEGINIVSQEITSFTLKNGDKVMLWYDMANLTPVCEALTVK